MRSSSPTAAPGRHARLAAARGARVVAAPRGRGRQLAAGVAAGDRAWLLVLHADARLRARRAARGGGGADAAGGRGRGVAARDRWRRAVAPLGRARRGAALAAHGPRLRRPGAAWCGAPHTRPWAATRTPASWRTWCWSAGSRGATRLRGFPAPILADARRWRREGRVRGTLRNVALLSLFLAGVPPDRLARWYRPEPGPDEAGARSLPQGAAARHRQDAARRRDRGAAGAPALSCPGASDARQARLAGLEATMWFTPADAAIEMRPGWARAGTCGRRHRATSARGWPRRRMRCAGAAAGSPSAPTVPRLDAALLRDAAPSSRATRSCWGRAEDGGYYLLGGPTPLPDLFSAMPVEHAAAVLAGDARAAGAREGALARARHPARRGHRGGRARRRTLDLIPGRGPYWPTPFPCPGARGWPGESSSTTTGDGPSRLPPNVARTRRTGISSFRSGRRRSGNDRSGRPIRSRPRPRPRCSRRPRRLSDDALTALLAEQLQ